MRPAKDSTAKGFLPRTDATVCGHESVIQKLENWSESVNFL